MKIGDIVKNGLNQEFEIVEIREGYEYPIKCQNCNTGEESTFTMDGKYQLYKVGPLDLILNLVTEPVEDVTEPVEDVTEPVEDVTEQTITIEGYDVIIGETWIDGRGDSYLVTDIRDPKIDLFPIKCEEGASFSKYGARYCITRAEEGKLDILMYPDYCIRNNQVIDITEPVEEVDKIIIEPVIEEVLPDEKFYTFDTSITPYEATLKATRVELSTEITGLIEDNGDISEIILKVKKLKKLLEL